MHIPENVETKTVTISGMEFTLPQPYTPEVFNKKALNGLGTPEVLARKMNQTLTEDLRNNWAQRIKKAESEKAPIPTQKDLDTYLLEYEPGIRGRGESAARDPIELEALRLAKSDLRAQLRAKGSASLNLQPGATVAKSTEQPKENQISFDNFIALAEKIIEKYPAYKEKAKEIVAAKNAVVAELKI